MIDSGLTLSLELLTSKTGLVKKKTKRQVMRLNTVLEYIKLKNLRIIVKGYRAVLI